MNTSVVIIAVVWLIGALCIQAYPIYPEGNDSSMMDAEVIVADGVPPSSFLDQVDDESDTEIEPIIDVLGDLRAFLADDVTEDEPLNIGVYDCKEYSVDLARNLSDAGFDTGCMLIVPKRHYYEVGHAMTSVVINGTVYIVEPQNDLIYYYDDWMGFIDEDEYVVRLVSIDVAESQRDDMRRWGVK